MSSRKEECKKLTGVVAEIVIPIVNEIEDGGLVVDLSSEADRIESGYAHAARALATGALGNVLGGEEVQLRAMKKSAKKHLADFGPGILKHMSPKMKEVLELDGLE